MKGSAATHRIAQEVVSARGQTLQPGAETRHTCGHRERVIGWTRRRSVPDNIEGDDVGIDGEVGHESFEIEAAAAKAVQKDIGLPCARPGDPSAGVWGSPEIERSRGRS